METVFLLKKLQVLREAKTRHNEPFECIEFIKNENELNDYLLKYRCLSLSEWELSLTFQNGNI